VRSSFMLFRRIVSSVILFTFVLTGGIPPSVNAQSTLHATPNILSLTADFHPVMIQGMRIHPDNPLKFDFIVDAGDASVDINGPQFKEATTKLIKYFLASLTVPEKEMWVNLSPYEKDRIIADGLGQTELGVDMLAQDYILKQLTSSLIYPDSKTGKVFWEKVYAQARETFGNTNVPINTFNKVWIVPDKAVVYEHGNTVYVVESHLKVMLEEDYLALGKNQGQPGDMALAVSPHTGDYRRSSPSRLPTELAMSVKASQGNHQAHSMASQITREIVLPELEKEVNGGRNFANLRQIYNAMILAVWYKLNLQKSLLGQVYADQNKTVGIDAADKTFRQRIYSDYIKSFKNGVFNYIREENDHQNGEAVARKYFSGGLVGEDAALLKVLTGSVPQAVLNNQVGTRVEVDSTLENTDHAMIVRSKEIFFLIKSWAKDSRLSDENRHILIENLGPDLVQRLDGILKGPNGQEAVERTTQNQLLHFIISAGLITGPPGQRVSAVFKLLIEHIQRIIDQDSLTSVERNFLESAIQANHFGHYHGGAVHIDNSLLDELLDSSTREFKKKSDVLPDTLLDDIQNSPLQMIGQGFTSFAFATPDGKNVIKYIKTPVSIAPDVPPGDHRFPQQSWAQDYGVTRGQLHPGLWEEIELFETYGEMGLSGRIYIADEAYHRLNNFEKERLRRYENAGIVRRILKPVEITAAYSPSVPVFDEQKVKDGAKISVSVLLAYPRILSLKDKFIQALKDHTLGRAERVKEALQWMDDTFAFIEELWEQGIFHTDATFFNIGVQTLGNDEERLAILDPHNWPIDFSSGLPFGATAQNIQEYLDNARAGSFWALMLIQQQSHQEDPEFMMELFSHFEQKTREVLTVENFRKHWRPFSSNIIAVSQKGVFYSHPLFKKFLEVEKQQYDASSNEHPLRVQGSVHLKAGIKNYEHKRLIVIFNPSDAYSSDGKEWGKVMIGDFAPAIDIKGKTKYLLKEQLTGEIYVRTGEQLAKGFLVGLAPYRMHVFSIEEVKGPLPVYQGDDVSWEFDHVIEKIDITPYVLPGFPATMILHARKDFPFHLLESAYVKFKGKGGRIEKHPFRRIPFAEDGNEDDVNYVWGQTVFFQEQGDHPFEIVLDVNGKTLTYKGIQKVEVPQPDELWQHGPLIIPVDDNLFLGNAAAAARPEFLAEKGIKAVANASLERDLSPVYYENISSRGIEYRQFGAVDMSYNPIPGSLLWEGAQWIYQEISSGKSVFVHCHAGVGRSSSLMIAYLFLFKYPDKSFDEVVDMVREKAAAVGHFIYPHAGLAETLEKLREEKRKEIESSLGHGYPTTVQMGRIQYVYFVGEFGQKGKTYTARVNQPFLIQAKVVYEGGQPPYGVFVNTNLNKDGAGEEILMHYNPVNSLYETRIIPQRKGKLFWLTHFALPHRNDHYSQRRWVGQNIYFQISDAAMKVVKDGTSSPGGIDLDPAILNLQIKREGEGVTVTPRGKDGVMRVNGFTPIITRITPMRSSLFSNQ